MARYELPPDLSPEEERAVIAALERALAAEEERPSPWALGGRVANLGLGSLQTRRDTERPWTFRGHAPFSRRGTPPLTGRGDAK